MLRDMVARHYPAPHRFVCITDDPTGIECETMPLWQDCGHLKNKSGDHLPSCYRRLKLFSKEVAGGLGGRIVSMDLDMVVVDDLRPLWDRPGNFLGWRVVGHQHPVVYNGSMFMHRAGTMRHLWDRFDPQVSPDVSKQQGYFGSDQGWISMNIKDRSLGWNARDGVLSYPREVRRRPLPDHARVVVFHGKRKPWDVAVQNEAPWVREHWRRG